MRFFGLRSMIFASCALACSTISTRADIEVSFRDSAPKDFFSVTNTGTCETGPVTLSVDMSSSAGRLIFDTTRSGAGVEVFQPLEFISGTEYLRRLPEIADGQSELVLEINSLPPGGQIGFTTDVDDTIGQREITVNGSEIAGSQLLVLAGFSAEPGIFDATATARVATPACVS